MNRRSIVTGMLFCLTSPIAFAHQTLSSNQREQSGAPISLDFVSIPLRQLLQIMADMKGLNLVMSEKVFGKMSIHIKQAPWQEVLDTIWLADL